MSKKSVVAGTHGRIAFRARLEKIGYLAADAVASAIHLASAAKYRVFVRHIHTTEVVRAGDVSELFVVREKMDARLVGCQKAEECLLTSVERIQSRRRTSVRRSRIASVSPRMQSHCTAFSTDVRADCAEAEKLRSVGGGMAFDSGVSCVTDVSAEPPSP